VFPDAACKFYLTADPAVRAQRRALERGTEEPDVAELARADCEPDAAHAFAEVHEAGKRDGHLRSPDFLDVEQFPYLTFKSTRVERAGEDQLKVTGDLTIRGTTRSVVLDTTLTGRGKAPFGTTVAGFEAHTTINRKDFGLNWNVALEAGGFLVGDTIKINIEAEAVLQQRLRAAAMEAGVTLIAPETVFLSADTKLGNLATSIAKSQLAAALALVPIVVMIAAVRASSASCAPRPGRKPYENPRKSSS